MWQELIRTLGDINAAYEKIFAVGKKKHDSLIMIKLQEVDKLLKDESKLVSEVYKLEDKRRAILVKLAGSHEKMRADMTMNELIAFAPPTMQHTLAVLHRQLSKQVGEVVKQNEVNSMLATGALDAVTKKLNQIGGVRADSGYGRTGDDVVSHRQNWEIKA